jgi:hypothetical protein
LRGSHTDYYEAPRVSVYQAKDRRAGKTIVFGQVSPLSFAVCRCRGCTLSSTPHLLHRFVFLKLSLTEHRTLCFQVMETPNELEQRAETMKFYRRETERRISKQQSMPHVSTHNLVCLLMGGSSLPDCLSLQILERAKVREAKLANKRESLGEEIGRISRAQSPLRRPLEVPLMYGNGSTVPASPWLYR